MKKLKSLLCTVMVLVLAVTLAVPVFAAETGTGTITITNAVPGAAYQAYKIFDLVKTGNAYSYTVTEPWKSFFAEGHQGAAFFQIDPVNGYVQWIGPATGPEENGKKTVSDSDMAAFTAVARENLGSLTPEGNAQGEDNGTAVIQGLQDGYYLVTTNNGALCALDSLTAPNVNVMEKNPAPVIKKTADKTSVTLGKQVFYVVPIVMGGSGSGSYRVVDTMKGLKLNNDLDVQVYRTAGKDVTAENLTAAIQNKQFSVDENATVTVTVNGQAHTLGTSNAFTKVKPAPQPGTDYTKVSTGDMELTVEIQEAYLNNLQTGDLIVLTYSGEATETNIENTVFMEYGNDPKITTPTDKAIVKSFSFELLKYHMKEEIQKVEEKLDGAVFQLYTQDKNFKDRQPVQFVRTQPEGGVAAYTVAITGQEQRVAEIEAGQVRIVGLAAGDYYLEEMKAPDGYNKLLEDVHITIDEKGNIAVSGNAAGHENQVKVENKSGAELPSTGGIGTTVFYVVGGLIMAAALVMFLTKKRMGE